MRFRVLGDVQPEPAVPLRPKQRELLAALLVRRGHPVSGQVLVDDLWDEPPAQALPGLHTHASRLRGALGDDSLTTGAGGYRVHGATDAERFEELFGSGRGALLDDRLEAAVDLLQEALALWRGPAYGAFADRPFARAEAARLEEVRRAAEDDLLRALLLLDRPAEALTALAAPLEREPYREHLWAVRLVALQRTGRQAQALHDYVRLHRLLDEELGVEPGPELRALHAALVRSERAQLPAGDAARVRAVRPLASAPGPTVRWASGDGAHIAYQVLGEGPVDLLWIPSYLSHLELHWQWPAYAGLLAELARHARLIVMDKRGVGLSDRVHTADLEVRADDVRAVLDAAGSRRAVVLASSDGATNAVPFAALHPDRVVGLVLFGCMPRLAGPGWDVGPTPARYLERMEQLYLQWGTGRSLGVFAPTAAADPEAVAWYARMERDALTPGGLLQMVRTSATLDVTPYLPRVQAPTLVLHRRDEAVPVEAARRTAGAVPRARLVELEGVDHLLWFGDVEAVLAEVVPFLRRLGEDEGAQP